MAHYDCDDCGSSLGIAYGHCDNCTPQRVMELERELIYQRETAKMEFDKMISAEKERYIKEKTKNIKEEYEREYEKHHPIQRR